MKCDKCWFCTKIGAGIYAPYPVKYCKHSEKYFTPFVVTGVDGKTVEQRQLDFRKMSDLKIWHETGCDIHPSTVAKAKRDFIKSLENKEREE